MDFHGITMKGKYKAQIVADASALIWGVTDERRLVYDQLTEEIWLADSSEWKSAGKNGDISTGIEMWVFANTAPDGWALSGTPADELLAVKGGLTYTTAQTAAGDFTLPLHTHNMSDHTHAVAGQTNASTMGSHDEGENDNCDLIDKNHYHFFNLVSGVGTPATTSSGGNEDYRPEAAVGLICSKL